MKRPFILLGILALASCGQGGDTALKSALSPVSLSSKLTAPQRMSAPQLALATELCSALRYKRLNFPQSFPSSNFSFYLEEQSCLESRMTVGQVEAVLKEISDGEYEFKSPYAGNYFKEFETDTLGVLSKICQEIASSKYPSNSEVLSKTTLRQYSFTKGSDEKSMIVSIVYGSSSSPADMNSYVSYKSDQFVVETVSELTPSLKGMLKERFTTERCSLGSMNAEKRLYTRFLRVK